MLGKGIHVKADGGGGGGRQVGSICMMGVAGGKCSRSGR